MLRLSDILTRKDPSAAGKLKRLCKKMSTGQAAKTDCKLLSYAFHVATGLSLAKFKPLDADPRPVHERDYVCLAGDAGGSMKAGWMASM